MKALSIKQPWAFLIIHGFTEYTDKGKIHHLKDIENRTWKTKYRGRFLVHASKQVDKVAWAKFVHSGHLNPDDLSLGAIIGSVDLVDVVESSESKWFQGPIGFVLKDPRPEKIQFIKGKLNFFEVNS